MKTAAFLSALAFTFIFSSAQAQWITQNSGFATPDLESIKYLACKRECGWAAAFDSTATSLSGFIR